MKKETLEEAKFKAWQNYEYGRGHLYSRTFYDAFDLGYNLAKKEQDKNNFSEEDMINRTQVVFELTNKGYSIDEIIEQFKKK
jgi:hypothetical protein